MTRVPGMTRRRVLQLTGSTASVGCAGCVREDSDNEDAEIEGEDRAEDELGEIDENGSGERSDNEDEAENTDGEEENEITVVIVSNTDEMTLAVVDVEIASTAEEQYTGLSNHESLEEDAGLLFVYNEEKTRTFVMREMEFPIDIIFIDADRQITTIYQAATGNGQSPLIEYRGQAQWVLEVPYEYAANNEIDEGNHVKIEYQ